jgi:hypothetical protein
MSKIVRLQSENIKRLHAVEITPEGSLIVVGGKNGMGKSSVLDSISYALGGEKLVPSEPIRTGETQASIVVELEDLIITRRFKRDKTHAEGCLSKIDIGTAETGPGTMGECNCTPTFSETRSTLTVTNREGAKYPSPQAVIDKLLGRLTFDPLQFARDEPKKQHETLRKLLGLDFSAIDERRREAASQRAILKKTYDIKMAQLLAMPTHKNAPEAEISIADLSRELQQADEYQRLADEAFAAVESARKAQKAIEDRRAEHVAEEDSIQKQIDALQIRLRAVNDQIASDDRGIEDSKREVEARTITAEAAKAVVPDRAAIVKRMEDAERVNGEVRNNRAYAAKAAEVDQTGTQANEQDAIVKAADEEKVALLAAAKFPVEGLGLSDDGVIFNGLPFDQAGSAEQVRVSVAIGIALNPKLKVLLIRNGNLLDHDSLKAVSAQAEAAGVQVWMEWVAAGKDGVVTVLMEDGEVAE